MFIHPVMTDVESFLVKYPKLTVSRFGREVANDPHLVPKMRRGRDITGRTEQRIRTFMDEYAAESARIECGLRPAKSSQASLPG